MTTANKISIARVIIVPFFISQVMYYVHNGEEFYRFMALLSFAIAALTDGIDGYIARRYNQRSELGVILDPLADKLLLLAGVVLLSLDHGEHFERLPLWLGITIISRDVILVLGTLVIHHHCGRVRVRPHLTGKTATVFQMAAVLWTLFKWDPVWLWWICLGAAVFTGISGILYVLEGIRQLNASPHSSATGAAQQSDEVVE